MLFYIKQGAHIVSQQYIPNQMSMLFTSKNLNQVKNKYF